MPATDALETSAKRVRRPNFTEREIEALVECYQANKAAIDATGDGPQGALAKTKAWARITDTLFAVSGIKRTPAEVKKKWTDYKSLNKKKGANVTRCLGRTGGGAAEVPPLTPLEERVVATLDRSTVVGINGSYDIGVTGGDVILRYNVQCSDPGPSSSATPLVPDACEGAELTSSTWISQTPSPASSQEAANVQQEVADSAPAVPTPRRGTTPRSRASSEASEIANTHKKMEQHLEALVDIQRRLLAIKEHKYKVRTLPGGRLELQ
ncbi:nuclear apoptosis-inducing factor 1-like [Ornithodoros turicata]|uniref:nuclear apoptosis-inducing factor 1-like n=1 Tax=Ornithodoros turicata TaxID=34597 RepID=UPI003139AA47